ncbi:MAG: inositol monophosphatase family protein [Pseudomonadota bacterium]
MVHVIDDRLDRKSVEIGGELMLLSDVLEALEDIVCYTSLYLRISQSAVSATSFKSDGSPRSSHDLLTARIMKQFIDIYLPQCNVEGEDIIPTDKGSDATIICDALDGTRAYLSHDLSIATCATLVLKGEVVASYLHNPISQRSFFYVDGQSYVKRFGYSRNPVHELPQKTSMHLRTNDPRSLSEIENCRLLDLYPTMDHENDPVRLGLDRLRFAVWGSDRTSGRSINMALARAAEGSYNILVFKPQGGGVKVNLRYIIHGWAIIRGAGMGLVDLATLQPIDDPLIDLEQCPSGLAFFSSRAIMEKAVPYIAPQLTLAERIQAGLA